MDPLSIAASVVALCTACNTAYKIARSIRRTSKTIKKVGNDIEKFAKDIDLFAIVLRAAFAAIEPYCNSDSMGTRVLAYLSGVKGLDRLVEQSKDITDDMDRYRQKMRDLKGKYQLIVAYKWRLQKKEIEDALKPAMASATCNLQIVISSMILEAMLKQAPSATTASKIKILKQEIKVHLRTISLLQKQLASHTGNSIHQTSRSQSSFHINIQGTLIKLAESLIHHEAVPGFPPLSPSSSSIRTLSTRNFIQPDDSPQRSRSHNVMSMSSRATRRSSATSPGPDNRFTERNSSQVSSKHRSSKSLPASIPPIQDLQSQQAPVSSHPRAAMGVSPRPNTTLIAHSNPTHETETTSLVLSSPPTEGDFIGTYSSSYLLHLNPNHKFAAESGYIYTPTVPVSATALVDSDFEGNLISQAYAISLGLAIEELEDKENESNETWIDFGNGQKERKVGTVALRWGYGLMQHKKSFTVHCWVCVYNIRKLVFGRPFVEKKNHYKNGDGN